MLISIHILKLIGFFISAEDSKFEFNLWSYNDKFNFKGNKKKLIDEGNLQEYIIY